MLPLDLNLGALCWCVGRPRLGVLAMLGDPKGGAQEVRRFPMEAGMPTRKIPAHLHARVGCGTKALLFGYFLLGLGKRK